MKTIFILLIVFITTTKLNAQTTVTGTVYADSTLPLSGVTVEIQNTIVSTVTDNDGKYGLSAGEDAVLVFRMNGYRTQEIQVHGRNIIDVYLQKAATPQVDGMINKNGSYPVRSNEAGKNQFIIYQF